MNCCCFVFDDTFNVLQAMEWIEENSAIEAIGMYKNPDTKEIFICTEPHQKDRKYITFQIDSHICGMKHN